MPSYYTMYSLYVSLLLLLLLFNLVILEEYVLQEWNMILIYKQRPHII